MNFRLFNYEQDNDLISQWRIDQDSNVIPKDVLSPFGFIVELNKTPIVAMWLYPMVGCKMCLIEGLISDPQSLKENRKLALDILFDNIHLVAKDMGYKYIVCMTDNPSVAERVQKYGYGKDSKIYTNFVGEL